MIPFGLRTPGGLGLFFRVRFRCGIAQVKAPHLHDEWGSLDLKSSVQHPCAHLFFELVSGNRTKRAYKPLPPLLWLGGCCGLFCLQQNLLALIFIHTPGLLASRECNGGVDWPVFLVGSETGTINFKPVIPPKPQTCQ